MKRDISVLKISWISSLIRLSPFDISTDSGRSRERNRRILLSAIAAALAKIISIATTFISIPLTLHYLGDERFGLWMTISSVIAMLNFADLGIGNGLLNAIAEADGKDDRRAIQGYISSAFAILSCITVCTLLIFYMISPHVQWGAFFNVKTGLAVEEANTAVSVFVICFALNIPACIVQRTQLGLQMGFIANLWQIVGSIVGLLAVLLVIHYNLGLPYLIGGFAGAPILISFLNGSLFFGKIRKDIRPKWRLVSKEATERIIKVGMLFFALQLAVSIAYASDNIVIAKTLGAAYVAQYSIPDKLFSIIPMVNGLLLIPLWSAYGEAISRGDAFWVKETFDKSLAIVITFAVLMVLSIFFLAGPILRLWIGGAVLPPTLLLFSIGVWKIIEAIGTTLSVLLNGANIVKSQVIAAISTAFISVLLKVTFIQKFGIVGIVWAMIVAYVACTLIPFIILTPKIFRNLKETKNTAATI